MQSYETRNILYRPPQESASKKLCFFVDEFMKRDYEMTQDELAGWNVIEQLMLVDHEAFGARPTSFYTRILKTTIDRLFNTGILNYLIYTYVFESKILNPSPSIPQILNVNDLLFGFNIWFGFCGISFILFVVELILDIRFLRKSIVLCFKPYKKIKRAKIYPLVNFKNIKIQSPKLVPAKLFKACKTLSENKTKPVFKSENESTSIQKETKTAATQAENKTIATQAETKTIATQT